MYVAWKRGLPRQFARFVLFRLIKKHSFNLLCVLDLFFRTLAVNSVSDFFFYGSTVLKANSSWNQPLSKKFGSKKKKKIWNRVDCQCSEIKSQNTQEIKRTLFNWTKQEKTCKFLRKSSFSSYVQYKNRKTNNSTYLVSVKPVWHCHDLETCQDHSKCYGQIMLREKYPYAKFDIYHIYSTWKNCNIKVFKR